ncbi:MAG: N4-gp56 family major capsid protein [Desulfotomaculales bacterium]
MAVQTYGGLSAQQKTFYDRALLERLLPKVVFLQHGQKRSIPKREGATINFRRFESLPVITTPLTEGQPPSGSNLTITQITATVAGYGDYVVLSDLLDMAGIDPVATETVEAQGEQAAVSLDTIVRNVVAAGTNVLYAVGSARNQITSDAVITSLLVRKARKIMARNNVKPAANNDYIAFIHPDAAFDLMGDSAWVNANQYAGSTQIFNGELGKLHGIRFIETTLAPIWTGAGSGGCDVYGTIVIGRDAYGIPDIAGSSKPETIIKPLGSAGTADPLNQQSSCGWKVYLTAVRLQELAILRIEHAVSA